MKMPDLPPNEAVRLRELHALNVLDTPQEDRFDRLTRMACRMFDMPIAVVSLVDANRLWFKSASGVESLEVPRNLSFCAHAILGEDALVIPDATKDPRFTDNPFVTGGPHVRFYAGCPIRVNGMKIGTLCLFDHRPRIFDANDAAMLKDLTGMVENELTAVQLATMDELTGLSNRRGFAAQAQQLLNLCRRMRLPASLFYLDLDDFKAVNDSFGHAEGDIALQNFARVMLQTFRGSDAVGRLGGDEFAVLVTNTRPVEAEAALQHLADAVQAHNKTGKRGYDLRYSVGMVSYEPAMDPSVAQLMAQADALMYQEKQS